MSENVIEKRICKWRSEQHDYPTHEAGRHAAAAVRLCADELQAATDPRQFMPRLDEWPEWAQWCCIRDCYGITGGPAFLSTEPIWKEDETGWTVKEEGKGQDGSPVRIPLGIDWRTLKVSRQQMEEWEENNET